MECYFDCYEMCDVRKIRFVRMRLVRPKFIGLLARERQRKNLIESSEEMKDKLKEKYLPLSFIGTIS